MNYVIKIYHNGMFVDYVSNINYTHNHWSSSKKPKVFSNIELCNKCINKIIELSPKLKFKICELKEVTLDESTSH